MIKSVMVQIPCTDLVLGVRRVSSQAVVRVVIVEDLCERQLIQQSTDIP